MCSCSIHYCYHVLNAFEYTVYFIASMSTITVLTCTHTIQQSSSDDVGNYIKDIL